MIFELASGSRKRWLTDLLEDNASETVADEYDWPLGKIS